MDDSLQGLAFNSCTVPASRSSVMPPASHHRPSVIIMIRGTIPRQQQWPRVCQIRELQTRRLLPSELSESSCVTGRHSSHDCNREALFVELFGPTWTNAVRHKG